MAALKVSKLLFLSYTTETSTAFMVTFDSVLWEEILVEAERLYSGQRPSKLSVFAKTTEAKLKQFVETHVVFIGEFPSRTRAVCPTNFLNTTDDIPYLVSGLHQSLQKRLQTSDLVTQLQKSIGLINKAFQLPRKKGVEVLVWLLQRTDRIYNPEAPYSIPIAYALKGYSLTGKVIRAMCEDVHTACRQKGISVVCIAFDGQWIGLVNRDGEGKPLTLLQLQRGVLGKARKVQKAVQLKSITKAVIGIQ